VAPQYIAEEQLRLEGFEEVEYVDRGVGTIPETLIQGRADLSMETAPETLPLVDAGSPLLVLAGIHTGCWELFGGESVRTVRDLKGKAVAIRSLGSTEHVFISSMLAYVGIDPHKDIRWVMGKSIPDTMRIFVDGQADAFLAFPPQPQELRARQVGRVIVDTAHDRPWSQYFCCIQTGNSDFVDRYPIATKRALRAVLKATDICATDPQRAARYIVAKGYEKRYDMALQVFSEIQYSHWREFDPEDTLRFHALRLREVGIIKSTPQKIIAQGTDWRFLNELKKELKT
jgi:NitT/TauT family transport system substrate-binding protein